MLKKKKTLLSCRDATAKDIKPLDPQSPDYRRQSPRRQEDPEGIISVAADAADVQEAPGGEEQDGQETVVAFHVDVHTKPFQELLITLPLSLSLFYNSLSPTPPPPTPLSIPYRPTKHYKSSTTRLRNCRSKGVLNSRCFVGTHRQIVSPREVRTIINALLSGHFFSKESHAIFKLAFIPT